MPRPRQRRPQPLLANGQQEYEPVFRLWFLRLILGIARETHSVLRLLEEDGWQMLASDGDPDFEELMRVGADENQTLKQVSKMRELVVRRQLRTKLRDLELDRPSLAGTPLGDNVEWLGRRLDLTPLECNILALATALSSGESLRAAVDSLRGRGSRQNMLNWVAYMMAESVQSIAKVLAPTSRLSQSGLVKLDMQSISTLESAFTCLPMLPDALMTPYQNQEELLERFFQPASPARLGKDDFPHLELDLGLLRQVLTQALLRREPGLNILLYGEPGVGKSEFARLLGQSAGAAVFEVGSDDEDGDILTDEGRFSSYMLCQRILAKGGDAIVLFDEIEDVFPDQGFGLLHLLAGNGGAHSKGVGKAWVNRVLDTNPVPAIWIANRVQHIDPAYLRRFDYALEIPRPPKAVRQRIAEKYFSGTKSRPEWVERVAGWGELTPAQLEKSARLARLAKPRTAKDAEYVAERALRLSARLLGQELPPASRPATVFRPECLNTSLDLAGLVPGLKRTPRATFCFYGPPGTGKTAFARHLAESLDKPLLVKRASDLLSKWVGEAERNIAAMFREAMDEGAVLVLDEADGLLADRRDARHSWEVTQVNEMLTHMEDFDGIFICTTNLLERLDPASLRRFAFKVRFDWLKPNQAVSLFEDAWRACSGKAAPVDEMLRRRLARLDNLTPGDFAAVARQRAVLGEAPTPADLVTALEEECRIKGAPPHRIGFAA